MNLSSRDSKYLDHQWFSRFKEHGTFSVIGNFNNGSRKRIEEQKKKFMNGQLERLDLSPVGVDMEAVNEHFNELEYLREDINCEEDNYIVRESYNRLIEEKIDELSLVKAAVKGDYAEFNRLTRSVYGAPTETPFNIIVHKIRRKLLNYDTHGNREIEGIIQRVLAALPEVGQVNEKQLLPPKEVFRQVKKEIEDQVGDLLRVVPETKEIINARQIKQVFTDALAVVGADDWKAVVDDHSAVSIIVDQKTKTVYVPAKRKVKRNKLRALVLHEIGTHIVRRIQGEQSVLRLLGLGLDGYLCGEEGVASMREQVVKGKIKIFAGTYRYLAMGLALGLDGKPRDFREVYEIMRDYFTIHNLSLGKELAEAKTKAAKRSWSEVIRTFRGTDGSAGTCLTKDTAYFQGNVNMWEAVVRNPEIIKSFNIGKYDPANAKHVRLLEQLGLIKSY